jgi:8-oxo-dGTP diphosphatase
VDEYIIKGNGAPELLESHPELCFKYLNNGKVVLTKKSRPEGITERLNILRGMDKELYRLYPLMLQSIPASMAKKDDMLDAMCLCLSNKLAMETGLCYFQDENGKDERDIPIRIAYCKP